jgi:hypothetical protein
MRTTNYLKVLAKDSKDSRDDEGGIQKVFSYFYFFATGNIKSFYRAEQHALYKVSKLKELQKYTQVSVYRVCDEAVGYPEIGEEHPDEAPIQN